MKPQFARELRQLRVLLCTRFWMKKFWLPNEDVIKFCTLWSSKYSKFPLQIICMIAMDKFWMRDRKLRYLKRSYINLVLHWRCLENGFFSGPFYLRHEIHYNVQLNLFSVNYASINQRCFSAMAKWH